MMGRKEGAACATQALRERGMRGRNVVSIFPPRLKSCVARSRVVSCRGASKLSMASAVGINYMVSHFTTLCTIERTGYRRCGRVEVATWSNEDDAGMPKVGGGRPLHACPCETQKPFPAGTLLRTPYKLRQGTLITMISQIFLTSRKDEILTPLLSSFLIFECLTSPRSASML
ncbi:hypothetical protein EV356DRAFT_261818 [Viridothelium virens]|uniref:Uncharacterized protein n=1 Tax=Viridothelium virens TaxID=1048519 RepID=A0A6A6H361_VIRVR|nr:hypothetical protein EV356DRAFT_261818 [Viridothelium virens]